MKNFAQFILSRPYLITSFVLLLAVLGFIGFRSMPLNLFPDASYPSIVVLVTYPQASAEDIEDKVTRPIERAISSISLVRKIRSITQDGMTAISAEFEYKKGLNTAALDVTNTIKRIEADLPKDILPPQIFKVSDATKPVMTLALRPKPGSHLTLEKVRQLADNEIIEEFLRIKEVGNVEVFGGYIPEVCVDIDARKLHALGLSLERVIMAIKSQNLNLPLGLILKRRQQFHLKISGEKKDISELEQIVIINNSGHQVLLKDVARVWVCHKDNQSFFLGNGHPAIGLNILRPETGHVTTTISAVEKALPEIEAKYPEISFEIVDTQKGLIKTSIKNMSEALRDSVIMTVSVIFLTLASLRLASLAVVSIPLACFMAFAGMYFLGYELNIVTLTAIILSVGLLVDDSIVVIENIERHVRVLGKPIKKAVIDGLNEIVLADWAGTFTTVIVLVPIMFVGGYPQKILRPLAVVLSLTLLASFLISVSVIPLLAPYIMSKTTKRNKIEHLVGYVDRFMLEPLRNLFAALVKIAISHQFLFILAGIVLLIISLRQISLVGRDLMPPMDTGIVKVAFETSANASFLSTEEVTKKVGSVLKNIPGLKLMSVAVGSEPGVISFGTSRTPNQGTVTVHFTDRFHRKETIWQIEEEIKKRILKIPGIKSVHVYDFGATPLSSISAPVDIKLSGPDPRVLDKLAKEVESRLFKVKGLSFVVRSWTWDKREYLLRINAAKAAYFGLDPVTISQQVAEAVSGSPVSVLRIRGEKGHTIRLRYEKELRNSLSDIQGMQLNSPKGLIPLSQVANIVPSLTRTKFTREDLNPTVDIYGYRYTTAISHLHEQIAKLLKDLPLPPGYQLSHEGEVKYMNDSGKRLIKALSVAVILLFFSLAITFHSWVTPLVIMVAIPFSVIGAVWGLLIVGRHMCMPAMMGMILLAGIVVNNSILLIDFIEKAKTKGVSLASAIEQAVRMRTRPILMTMASTVVGMWPVAAERALGLERLSPLAVVAIGGLIVSTFLTLIYVPIFYSLVDGIREKIKSKKP